MENPLNNNKKPRTEEEIKELKKKFEDKLGKEGISHDYINESLAALTRCESLLKPDNLLSGTQKLITREKILKQIKNYPSYTEYVVKNKLPDTLTSIESKKIVKRLDEIAAEVKSLANNDDSSKIDIVNLKILLTEAYELIYSQ